MSKLDSFLLLVGLLELFPHLLGVILDHHFF